MVAGHATCQLMIGFWVLMLAVAVFVVVVALLDDMVVVVLCFGFDLICGGLCLRIDPNFFLTMLSLFFVLALI